MKNKEEIYINFIREFEEIKNFHSLTKKTYQLSVITLENTKESKDIPNNLINKNTEMSYTPADIEIENIKQVSEWISLEDYAKKSKCDHEDIKKQAAAGLLGQVLNENGQKYLIWPPEQQNSNNLPKDSKKKCFEVNLTNRMDACIQIDDKNFLNFMKNHTPEIDEQTKKANLLLNKETLLLYWTIFESFIKEYTYRLIEVYPETMFNSDKYSKKVITFIDLFNSSDGLTNIDSLKETMINNIIKDRAEEEREPISKILIFIKECFKSQNIDPFKTWYVFKKIKIDITYDEINQIRIIRNGLVHNNGKLSKKNWEKISLINKPENDVIIVDNELLEKVYLILKSCTYNLNRLLSKKS